MTPACGTGGFLLAAHEYLKSHFELDRDQKRHLRFEALRGVEPVPNVARLCGMNLCLHGIGPDGGDRHAPPIRTDDALRDAPGAHADVVVTNPPFGKKSSITIVNEEGDTDRQSLTYNRPDFWTTTSNKQLNFVQHVKSLLKVNGRAAVVVPDNVRIPAIPAIHSGVSRPPVPVQAGHLFRSKSATRRSEATVGGFSRGLQARGSDRWPFASWTLLSG